MAVDTATGATRGSSLVGSTFNQILKELYRPAVVDQLNSKTVLARRLGRRSEGMLEGKYMVIDLNVGRNFGYGVAGEDGRLPDPQAQQFKQARYNARYSYGRIKFTGPSASASRSDRGSFIRIMDAEIQGMARDIQHDTNRIMFGNGSGRLAEIVSGAGAGPWVVSNPGGIVNSALGTQYLFENMRVGSLNNDTGAVAVGTQPSAAFAGGLRAAFISTVDRTAGTVSFKDAAGAPIVFTKTGTMYLYIANESSTDLPGNSWARGLEPNGLAAIIDDADPVFQDGVSWPAGLGEVPIATNPIWKAPVIDNGGTAIPFQQDMLQQLQDLVDQTSDGEINLYVTTHGIRRQYLAQLVGSKQYVNTMELDGGFTSLTYDGRPLVVDKDCTRGRIYGLCEECVFPMYETDWDWMDQDGAVLHRMQNKDAFQACMLRYWQMGTDQRNRNGLIEDIQDV